MANDPKDPWGYLSSGTADGTWYENSFKQLHGEFIAVNKPKCDCGTTITLGKDDHAMYHSDWCEIKKQYEKENK